MLLTDPQPGTAQDGQPNPGERIIQASNGIHHRRVDVGGQCAWQRLVEFGDVGGEDQPPWRRLLPAPGGDVVEQVAQAEHRRLGDRGRHGDPGKGSASHQAGAPRPFAGRSLSLSTAPDGVEDLVGKHFGLVERQLPDWGKSAAHEKAMAITATMVGALLLARAADDAQLSRSIRKAARELIRGLGG